MIFNNPLDILKFYINSYVRSGDTAIDATLGNGHDTKTLLEAVGESGTVYGFDIQEAAIHSTRSLIGNADNARLILDSHAEVDKYVTDKIRCAVFNLGYLPGGDHNIATQPDSSIEAIGKCVDLLDDDGFVAVTIYHGGDTGFTEHDNVLEYLKTLNCRKYGVTLYSFHNRPNNPPIFAVIEKRIAIQR